VLALSASASAQQWKVYQGESVSLDYRNAADSESLLSVACGSSHSDITIPLVPDGRGEGDGGAGPEYYTKLDACREEAKQEKLPDVSVDSVTSDDADAPTDADCDVKCAGELIRKFMLSNPEPAQAQAEPDDE
jgi:hypothetical protein